MKRTFLFTFKVEQSTDWNTYQFIVISQNGKLPDLNNLIDLAEKRWKAHSVTFQFLCYSEFAKQSDPQDLLGDMLKSADIFEVDKNDIIKMKQRSS